MFLRNSRYYPARSFEPDDAGEVPFDGVLANETDVATGYIEHGVAQGERLEQLARHYYGDGRRWWRIADANPNIILCGDLLDDAMIGERILIPMAKEIDDVSLLDALTTPKREPAECIVTVDGQEVSEFYPFLAEVTVETNRKAGWTASLKLETRRNPDGTWVIEDAGVFVPWAEIKIEAVFGQSDNEEVFRGYIKQVKTDYPESSGSATVTVACLDQSMAMDRKHERKEWGEDGPGDDTSVLSAVAGEVGLAPSPDNAPGQSGIKFNQDDTDIKLLEKRAEANGYELIVAEGAIYFGPMRLDHAPQDTIVVYGGRSTNCVRFGIEDLADKPDKVAFDFPDEQSGETVERVVSPDLFVLGNEAATNSAAGLPEYVWKMTRQGKQTESELETLAQRKVNEESFKVKAQGELDGSLYGHVLMVGLPVGVDGIGERHSGVYYADAVRHTFDMRGYRQTFTLIRNAYGDNLGAASGLSTAVAAAL